MSTLESAAGGPSKDCPPPSTARAAVFLGGVGLMYFAAHKLAFLFPDGQQILMAVWPAGGIGLAALLLRPQRQWPVLLAVLFLAGNAANLTAGRPLGTSLGFMAGNLLESFGCAWVLRRWCGEQVRFARVQEVLALLLGATLVNGLSALVGAATAALSSGTAFGPFYGTWWVSDGLGLLLVTPLLVCWATRGGLEARWERRLERLLLLGLTGVASTVAFGSARVNPGLLVRPYWLCGFTLWAGLRFGPRLMATVSAEMAAIAVYLTATGQSAFVLGGADPAQRLLMVQLFLGVTAATGMLLAATLADQQAAARQLRESEAFLDHVLESSPNAMWVADAQGTLIRTNPALCQSLQVRAEELVGKYNVFQDNVIESAGFMPLVKSVFDAGKTVRFTLAYDRAALQSLALREKSTAVLDVSLSPVLDAAGRVSHVVCQHLDVTEREQSQAALRESQQCVQTLLRTSMDGYACVDGEGRLLAVNEAYCRMTGYTEAELLQRRIADLEAADTPADIAARMEKLRTVGQARFETRHRRRDGSSFDVEVSIQYLPLAGGRMYAFVRDITERVRAERGLRESEARFRTVVERAPVAIGISRQGRSLYANANYLKLFGLKRPQEILGRSVLEHWSPASQPLLPAWTRLPRPALPEAPEFERVALRKDGTCFPAHVGATAVELPDGPAILSFITDLTERKQTETLMTARAELAELAQRGSMDELLQAALDKAEALTGSQIGFFHFVAKDQQHLCLQQWSTHTLESLCSLQRKGQHLPIGQAGVWAECLRTSAPVVYNDFASAPHRKGLPAGHAPIQRLLVVPVLRDGLAVTVLGVGNKATDYTAADVKLVQQMAEIVADYALRKEAEENLRQNRAKLEAALASMTDAVFISDAKGEFIDVNEAFATFHRFPTKEQCSRERTELAKLLELSWPDGTEVPLDQRPVALALRGQRATSMEYCLRRTDTGEKWVGSFSFGPIRDHAGSIVGAVVTARDITERKALAAQLHQAQKMESVGQLAGGVAHDFNNILAAIILHLGLLKQNAHLDPATQQSLDELMAGAQRAANLTRQLLMFSRRSVLEVKPLDLNAVVANLLKMLKRLIGEHIRMVFEPNVALPSVVADPGMMEQVLMNLCVNARDAMPKGGTLTIGLEVVDVEAARVRPHTGAQPGSYVCLSVTDTGCGMDEATLQHLFEPFFTTKPAGKGTGLGLATIHGIVGQHQGWVEVESQPGQGSTFRVLLPAAAKPAAAAELVQKPQPLRGHETVLVAEDEAPVRQVLVHSLRRLGYTVLEAANGQEALQLWEEQHAHIALLLSDMMMPGGMTGVELAEKLRERNPALKVIIASGYSAELVAQGFPSGKQISRLQKPFTLASLSQAIRDCLDQREGKY